MGSYTPRHPAQEPKGRASVLGRRGAAVAAGAAIVVPALTGMGSASAHERSTPAAAPSQASSSTGGAANTAFQSTPSGTTVLHYGSTGQLVKTLQERIGGLAVDGSFGPQTLAAVKHYQSSHGLAVDGYVGPKTWASLGGASGSSGGSSADATTVAATTSSSGVVGIAKQYLGTPYVFGGESPSGFDCSGFVQYVFGKAGISVPRTSSAQQAAATPVSNPQPGDVVFFGNPAYHDGIYIGGGKMISARKPGTVVDIGGMYAPHTFGRLG